MMLNRNPLKSLRYFIHPFYFLSLFFSLNLMTMSAQKLDGTYRLHGVHDMASAFLFTPDGKFQFFNMYGAIDRHATGTYTMEGNIVKLHSDKEPGKDFPVSAQSKKGKGYTIKVDEPNDYLRKYVIALYEADGTRQSAEPDNEGMIHIEQEHLDTIHLMHQLFPDIACLLKDKGNPNNYFEVKLSPTLAGVSFMGIDLTKDGDTLTCLPNYFLPYEDLRFIREQ